MLSDRAQEAIELLDELEGITLDYEIALTQLITTIEHNGKIIICGNGGSMADAMHFAEELTGKFRKKRKGIKVLCPSDAAYLTCVANDFGYEEVFSRYIETFAERGDTVILLSTSGKSDNIINAYGYSHEKGIETIQLLGDVKYPYGISLSIKSTKSERIQEVHMFLLHCLVEDIEKHFFRE